jgi:hypothetical protein
MDVIEQQMQVESGELAKLRVTTHVQVTSR